MSAASALATFSSPGFPSSRLVHHWSDLELGLAEMRRVARRQVVMTIDPPVHDAIWLLQEYVPAIIGMSGANGGHAARACERSRS